MKHRFDRYGFRGLDLDQARSLVETALGIRLQQRDSMYRGLYYRGVGEHRKTFVLEWDEDETEEFRARLSVNKAADLDAICDKLTSGRSNVVLLDSETLEVPDDDEARDEE